MAWASRAIDGRCALVLALGLCLVSWAPASPLRAQAPGVEAADHKPAEPAVTPEEAPPDDLDEPAAKPVSAGSGERAELEKQLQAVTREREESSNLLPWLTIGLGIASVVTGTTTGVVSSFGCKPDEGGCDAPPWAALAVVVGAAISTAGAIWLVRTNEGIAELELKKNQLKYDLDRLDARREHGTGLARAGASELRWTLEF
jgi:hypothetical protein